MDRNINNSRTPSINPAIIPNVVETFKKFSVGAVKELACLRQLSQLYYETLGLTYIKEFNKPIIIDGEELKLKLEDLSEPFIYRRIIINSYKYNYISLGCVPTRILSHITNIEVALSKYQNLLDWESKGEEESIAKAVWLCKDYLKKLPNLKTLDVKYSCSNGKIFPSELLSKLPSTIQLNLHIENITLRSLSRFIDEFKRNNKPSNLSLQIKTLHHYPKYLFHLVNPSVQSWHDLMKSKIEEISTYAECLKYGIETLDQVITKWKVNTVIFKSNEPITEPWPLSHQSWTQQISKLHLINYSRTLNFIKDMPKLKILILEHIDIFPCLFWDIELNGKENLQAIFDGLKNLEVKLLRSSAKPGYDKITPGNHVAEYIGTLVRKFEVV